jgi:hypothetical protein
MIRVWEATKPRSSERKSTINHWLSKSF